MLPNADPHAPTASQPLAGWAHRPHPAGQPARPEADDALVHLAGVILGFLAALLLATAAAVIGLAAYGLITWRRTRWWPPILLGALLGVIAVAALGGPGPALHHHLLAARELTAPHPGSLADLIAHRWAAWTAAQLPLSVPLGLIAAGLARHRVTHQPAHELSLGAQARRAAEEHAQLRRARRRAGDAPLHVRDKPVLGTWVAGDLTDWQTGEWATIPAGTLGLGTIVLGLPGTGKTETLLRLAQLGLTGGFDVHVIDAKGDPATQQRFAAIAETCGCEAKLFPQEPYDGWRGDPTALRNRFARIVDYTEPYYQDGARVLLHSATAAPLHGMEELISRLGDQDDVDQAVRKGAVSRYRSFSAAVGQQLSGQWAFEDTRASYLLLDGVAMGDDTPRLARYLLEDFQHYASNRKEPGQKALLIVDEFSALRVSNAAALLERLRSFGVGVIIASQSVEGLHDDPNERARLLGAASTVIAHRLADPEPIAARAGTKQRTERSHQLDHLGATGMGSLRIQETYRIDPNDLRNLPPGVAWLTTAGRAAKVCVSRGGQALTAGPSRRGRAGDKRVGRGNPVLGRASVTVDGPEEIGLFEARLSPTTAATEGADEPQSAERCAVPRATSVFVEQQTLPIEELPAPPAADDQHPTDEPTGESSPDPGPPEEPPPTRVSPYAKGL